MSDEQPQPEQPQPEWRRLRRPVLFDKIIDTLKQVRDAVEVEVVKEREKLQRLREQQGQGGRRG